MPLVSLCMIVKNEEDVLQRCMESVQGLVDEIVIVDTGSTDRTKEIARQYTDKLFDFEWTNNFAEARNESLRHATGDWILVLDADEYVHDEGKAELRRFLESSDPTKGTVFVLPILNITGKTGSFQFVESTSPRLFPNGCGIKYTRPIHEQLTSDRMPLIYKLYPYRIYHTGYTTERVESKQKTARNIEIFEKQFSTGLEDPYDWFCLANEYQALGCYEKAVNYYEKAYRKANIAIHPWYPYCLAFLINTYFSLNQVEKAYPLIREGVRLWPEHPDFYCLEGIVYQYFGYFREAVARFEKCIRLADLLSEKKLPECLVSPNYAYVIPFEGLKNQYLCSLDLQKTVYYLTKELQANPRKLETAVKLATVLGRREPTDSVRQFFNKLYPPEQNQNALHLFRVFLLAGYADLAETYYAECNTRGIALNESETCRYALLVKNRRLFEATVHSLERSEHDRPAVAKYRLIAELLWNTEPYSEANGSDQDPFVSGSDSANPESALRSFVTGKNSESESGVDPAELGSFLVELFTLQCYDAFDRVIERVTSGDALETVARHLFFTCEWELALLFYEHVLRRGEPSALGYEQLYYLTAGQGNTEEAISFISKAIDLEPRVVHRYGLLFQLAKKRGIVEHYKRKLFSEYPQYKSLAFLKS